jgi:L-rhamnonate dehydratase
LLHPVSPKSDTICLIAWLSGILHLFGFAGSSSWNQRDAQGSIAVKITEIRTRVVEWREKTVPAQAHFCTNPVDLLDLPTDTMTTFRFHSWLIVEVRSDSGETGIGNAALCPRVTKQVVDAYLKPILLGQNPFDYEYLWQHMYRRTVAFGRKGVGMVAISAVDIALWDLMGKLVKQPVFRLLGGKTKTRIPAYASRLYSQPVDDLRKEASRYKAEGFKAMKLRFGWGPLDGAEGMQRNLELVRTARETVGDGIDLMADAYMGWTLDYARRMIPLLEPYHLRWVEEPVLPDDIGGYAALKAMNIVPISGGEHEFTLYGFRELIDAKAVDVIQFDTNRVGGITQAKKISALAEAYEIPVIPHAGQLHNFHVVMASLNSPMAEYFPPVAVEIGNELFWYIFKGEPLAQDGFIDLDENAAGLGLEIDEEGLKKFEVIE